jgi:hypothetical protein
MPRTEQHEKPERSASKPFLGMLRKKREMFLQISLYTLFVCVIFFVGTAVWSERRTNCYNIRNSSTALPISFASFAGLHLPFTTQPSQVVHLGTDVLPINTAASSSKIGKCTVMRGRYDRYGPGQYPAFDSHLRHSEIHHYPIFVLDRPTMAGLWSKEAALLAVLLHEMSKPEGIRLRWLMWFDADTLVINPLIPIKSFLPTKHLDGINLLVTEDWNKKLNNGAFLLRVSAWSVNFLTNIVSYPSYKPDQDLAFAEQSAMERMIQDPKYASGCIYVPPRWFNTYPRGEDEFWTKYHVERGDMMLHFARAGDRPRMIRAFNEHVASEREKWEIPISKTTLPEEVADFWRNVWMQRNL